jgi:molybdopterin/thiamine biosynthesis adenylyltransferase
VTPWFERLPERLEYELQALRDARFTAEIDEQARRGGQLVMKVSCPIKGTDQELQVVFPARYPYFPFQVIAPSLSLARHQDPYSKALCFVAGIESEWRTDDTVAKYLVDKLPEVLRANDSSGPFDGEGHEGAPVTLYLPFDRDSVVLIGDWTLPSRATRGTLLLAIERDREGPIFRAAVREIKDEHGSTLGVLESRVAEPFRKRLSARWVRLPTRPKSADRNSILEEIIQAWPAARTPNFQGGEVDVTGIVFPDEVRYRELGDTWIFLLRRKAGHFPTSNPRKRGAPRLAVSLVRADRTGRSDLQARVPRLVPIADRKAAVFGLGALGSMVAWQLARAGTGHLALIENDFVNGATAPRWVLGLSAAGRDKGTVLAEHLLREYPYISVDPIWYRVGNPAFDQLADDALHRSLDGADVIVDCTVEKTVQHYLSSIARERGLPYIWASGTPGGCGGIVGRISPDKSRGCWNCFRGHLNDGTIPEPQAEDEADIQPVGCDAPTFRGAGFDMDAIAITCARLAASTMCRGAKDGYGDFAWDVAVVDLREDGHPIAPRWKTFELPLHRGCDAHS